MLELKLEQYLWFQLRTAGYRKIFFLTRADAQIENTESECRLLKGHLAMREELWKVYKKRKKVERA